MFTRDQQIARDQAADELAKVQKELADRKEQAERQWAEQEKPLAAREQDLATREQELAELRGVGFVRQDTVYGMSWYCWQLANLRSRSRSMSLTS